MHVVYPPITGNTIQIGTEVVFRRDTDDPAIVNFLKIVRVDPP